MRRCHRKEFPNRTKRYQRHRASNRNDAAQFILLGGDTVQVAPAS